MLMGASDRKGPVAGEYQTLKIDIAPMGLIAEFSVDGVVIYRHVGTTLVTADVPLTPMFVVTEGTTAINFDVDYVYVEASRIA